MVPIQLLPCPSCELDKISTDADYTIFQWRQSGNADSPTVYLRNPSEPLPSQSSYRNSSFYLFRSEHSGSVRHNSPHDSSSARSGKKRQSAQRDDVLKHKKEFEAFHTSNGVRTITGSIGPVQNGKPFVIFSSFRLLTVFFQYVCSSRPDIDTCIYPESLL